MEVTSEYQYLGIKLGPSGSLQFAVNELHDKATRAWFGISSVIFKNIRMEPNKIFGIFDSLVTPVALYGCEFWLPYLLKKADFHSSDSLLNSWESAKYETLNQKCSRMILSVHSKSSRLAVLGELGRYPLFIRALAQAIKFKYSLSIRKQSSDLICNVMTEMSKMESVGQDCWLTRINKIEKILDLKRGYSALLSKIPKSLFISQLKSRFDVHWLRKINEIKNNHGETFNHNKLCVYNQFKASFDIEPYINYVRNRNQRSFLTRLRISSHSSATELGRRSRPVIPYDKRVCSFCPPVSNCMPNQTCSPAASSGAVDSEVHFLMNCTRFSNSRRHFFDNASRLIPGFSNMDDDHKFVTLLCPTNAQTAKLTNRFIKFMFEMRKRIELGENMFQL